MPTLVKSRPVVKQSQKLATTSFYRSVGFGPVHHWLKCPDICAGTSPWSTDYLLGGSEVLFQISIAFHLHLQQKPNGWKKQLEPSTIFKREKWSIFCLLDFRRSEEFRKVKEKDMESNGERQIGYFLAGMGLGAIVALLFAPRSGGQTREYIRERADDLKRQAGEFRQRTEGMVEKGKEFVEREKETVQKAVESAKQAYRGESQKT